MHQYVKGWPYISLNQCKHKCTFFHVQLWDSQQLFFSPSHSLFYFLSSLTSSVGMWLSERERRKGWKSAEQMNEQSVVWYQGRVDCSVESRDRRRKRKPADCRAGVALHRRGPLIKSEGQTWELTQASAAASQRRRRGGSRSPSLTTPHPLRPAGRPAGPSEGWGEGRAPAARLALCVDS